MFTSYTWYVSGSGKICIFYQNWDFATFSISNVWITSVLCKYEHLQIHHQWATALIILLPTLRKVNLHVLILKIEHYSKCRIFADPVTYTCIYTTCVLYLHNSVIYVRTACVYCTNVRNNVYIHLVYTSTCVILPIMWFISDVV